MRYCFPKPLLLDSVSSTNDFLRQFVSQGLPKAVMARTQTRGRGRHGRRWSSARDQGLFVSYLFYPDLPAPLAVRLNTASSLAVALTLEELCPDSSIQLKRPNDVLLNQGKICGILLETATIGERINWAIIGIGINLSQQSFRFHTQPPPTSLWLEGIPAPPREKIYDILTRYLVQLLRESRGGAWDRIEDEVGRRLWRPESRVEKS